ncbi:TPA: phage holin family protein [Citrobacter amalonaticus]|nr:phage holin family protein [Citrobacter amalonaticus]
MKPPSQRAAPGSPLRRSYRRRSGEALTAFFTALLFSLWDGEGWRRSINAGLICFIVSAAVVSAMHQPGMSDQDWSFIIGTTVGGIGVDRSRASPRVPEMAACTLWMYHILNDRGWAVFSYRSL